MPSFDIVSELNRQELKNAIDQVHREIKQRFDFKGSRSEIKEEKDHLMFISDDEFKMKALVDIFQTKAARRGLNLKAFDYGKVEPAAGNTVRCMVKVVEGIDMDKARELVKKIKDLKIKVQAAIQESQVRVSGKKRDDLQEVIAVIKALDYPIPLQFVNYRD
ncbi:MAG: YajQ family cyclic di-GMP-binding protein [Pseudomonadota bacterium]